MTPSPRSRRLDLALLLLRVSFGGGLAVAHGWGKLVRFEELASRFADPLRVGSAISLSLAILGEVVGAAAVVVGITTRAAALLPLATMAVAFFLQHGGDPFGRRELAFAYGVGFLVIALAGPGRYSLDGWLQRRRRRRRRRKGTSP